MRIGWADDGVKGDEVDSPTGADTVCRVGWCRRGKQGARLEGARWLD